MSNILKHGGLSCPMLGFVSMIILYNEHRLNIRPKKRRGVSAPRGNQSGTRIWTYY